MYKVWFPKGACHQILRDCSKSRTSVQHGEFLRGKKQSPQWGELLLGNTNTPCTPWASAGLKIISRSLCAARVKRSISHRRDGSITHTSHTEAIPAFPHAQSSEMQDCLKFVFKIKSWAQHSFRHAWAAWFYSTACSALLQTLGISEFFWESPLLLTRTPSRPAALAADRAAVLGVVVSLQHHRLLWICRKDEVPSLFGTACLTGDHWAHLSTDQTLQNQSQGKIKKEKSPDSNISFILLVSIF